MGHFSDIFCKCRKRRLHLQKQFNMKLLSKKTGRKTFLSFSKSQNHKKNLHGLFSPESSILLPPIASGTNCVLSILPKSRQILLWVKPWLQCKSIKSVYRDIILELKLQDFMITQIIFKWIVKLIPSFSCLQFNLTFSFGKNITFTFSLFHFLWDVHTNNYSK